MVFLHGGAFVTGSGLEPWYAGTMLAAEQQVVVVSVSYRLGPLGWLQLDGVSPANLGLLDQIAALHWVHGAVERFGRDPDQVTLFGQSAGGGSVGLLTDAPDARGLFRRAVVQSGVPRGVLAGPDRVRLAEVLDGDLRSAPVERLLDAAQVVTREQSRDVGGVALPPWGPVVGRPPVAASSPADGAGVSDLLIGWNRDDVSAFGVGPDRAPVLSRRLFGDGWRDQVSGLLAAGAQVRGYRLDWRPDGSAYGATHCLELPLLLGTDEAWAGSPMLGTQGVARTGAVGRQLRAAWAGFARHGVGDATSTPDVPIRWTRGGELPGPEDP